ncbi:MAG: DNA polymerase III subunit delta', partial [Mycobacteriales bacterium]
LRLPTRLGSVAGALAAAADVVEAAAEEAAAAAEARDAAETAALRTALGVVPGRRGGAPRGASGALRDLERAQKSRGTRTQRDVLDRALVDLAGFYRDVLVTQLRAGVPAVHPDQGGAVTQLAGATRPEATLRRVAAVLACREAIAANGAPQLALEAMALALRAG